MFGMLVIFCSSGLLMVALSVPLTLKRIAPNHWYGFRVQATLSDSRIWYPANAYAAWRLLGTGVLAVLASVAVYFVPDMTVDRYGLLIALLILGGTIVTVIQSFLYLCKLTKGLVTSGDSDR